MVQNYCNLWEMNREVLVPLARLLGEARVVSDPKSKKHKTFEHNIVLRNFEELVAHEVIISKSEFNAIIDITQMLVSTS